MAYLFEKVKEFEELSTFVDLIERVELSAVLGRSGHFTVFAPTNEAFASAPQDILENFMKMFFNMKTLVTHHIVLGEFKHGDFLTRGKENIKTVAGTTLRITDTYGIARIAGARILNQDIECDNGVLHIIERVILPSGKLPGQ